TSDLSGSLGGSNGEAGTAPSLKAGRCWGDTSPLARGRSRILGQMRAGVFRPRPAGRGGRRGEGRRRERMALPIVATETPSAMPDGMKAAEVPPDEHPQPGAGAPARLLGELQGHLLEHDDVVLAHRALLLMAEDALQVDALQRDEGAGGVRRRPRELLVVGGDEVLGEVGVGGGDRGDAGAVEFVDEPALEGPIEALTAAPPL